jgi:hypothetical protein
MSGERLLSFLLSIVDGQRKKSLSRSFNFFNRLHYYCSNYSGRCTYTKNRYTHMQYNSFLLLEIRKFLVYRTVRQQ